MPIRQKLLYFNAIALIFVFTEAVMAQGKPTLATVRNSALPTAQVPLLSEVRNLPVAERNQVPEARSKLPPELRIVPVHEWPQLKELPISNDLLRLESSGQRKAKMVAVFEPHHTSQSEGNFNSGQIRFASQEADGKVVEGLFEVPPLDSRTSMLANSLTTIADGGNFGIQISRTVHKNHTYVTMVDGLTAMAVDGYTYRARKSLLQYAENKKSDPAVNILLYPKSNSQPELLSVSLQHGTNRIEAKIHTSAFDGKVIDFSVKQGARGPELFVITARDGVVSQSKVTFEKMDPRAADRNISQQYKYKISETHSIYSPNLLAERIEYSATEQAASTRGLLIKTGSAKAETAGAK